MNIMNPYQQFIPQKFTPNTNGITWVQGIEGAKAFQLIPNSNAVLLDSENEYFYIKTCDNVGMCNLRTFKYEELQNPCKNTNDNVDLSQFVTKAELEEAINNIWKGKQY